MEVCREVESSALLKSKNTPEQKPAFGKLTQREFVWWRLALLRFLRDLPRNRPKKQKPSQMTDSSRHLSWG